MRSSISILSGFWLWSLLLVSFTQGEAFFDILVREFEEAEAEVQALKQKGGDSVRLQEAEAKVRLLQERNQKFLARPANASYRVYAMNSSQGFQYLREADEVYANFRKVFTQFRFSNRYPAHFLVYPNRESYQKYERVAQWMGGHAISYRMQTSKQVNGQWQREPIEGAKLQRLAFYLPSASDPSGTTFAHELVHVYVWDLLNQKSAISDIRGNRFLNEGVAEYFALLHKPSEQSVRLEPLRKTRQPMGPLQWLNMSGYPPEPFIGEYYAEAYLFVKWLMEKPQAGARLEFLLPLTNVAEMEEAIKRMAIERSIPRVDFREYAEYRKKTLGF